MGVTYLLKANHVIERVAQDSNLVITFKARGEIRMDNIAPLQLLPVHELLGKHFFIPSYQRGYRWTKTQVTDLLEDIWNFEPPPVKEGEIRDTYCLQPIVVRNRATEETPEWEVIDGQQRLTTIKIILEYLYKQFPRVVHKPFPLTYETRQTHDGSDYFEVMHDPALATQSIDAFHIHAAYVCVEEWFGEKTKQNTTITFEFFPKIINQASVIWYNAIIVVDTEEKAAAIEIFTRLNIGKIALTNAELIKALFMQRGNFTESEIDAMQIQIATGWDSMQKKLQNDAFWHFIFNPSLTGVDYEDTRIDYIFDMWLDKKDKDEPYETFIKFNRRFNTEVQKSAGLFDLWLEVENYFQILEEWYEDRNLYHIIGFLITCGVSLRKLHAESRLDKDAFQKFLDEQIRATLPKPLERLEYGDKNTKPALLLFNILTMNSADSPMRFPFDRYKNKDNIWDIEHVRSQTDKPLTLATWREWALDILVFFSGYNEDKYDFEALKQFTRKYIEPDGTDGASTLTSQGSGVPLRAEEHKEKKKICKTLLILLNEEKPDFNKVTVAYKRVLRLYGEDAPMKNIHNIANLSLLDANTNRSYQNAMFSVKRNTISKKEMQGVFVPLCTKNLFMKFYSTGDTDTLFWKAADADAYLAAMKLCLKDYLPMETSHG